MQRLRRLTRILEDDAMMAGIKHPQEYNYFRIMRFHMLVINAWPGREIGENLSKFWILVAFGHFVLHALFLTGGFIYIKTTLLDFFKIVHVWIVQLMWMLVMSRIILLNLSTTYKKVFKTFLTKMHLFYYKHLSTYAMKTHRRVHFISHFFTVLIIMQMLSVCLFFQLVPICKNYFAGKYSEDMSRNVTYELAFYYSFPYQRTTKGHIFACVLNWFAAYFMAVWFCLLDLMLSLLVFNIWGHLKILIHELESFQLPANKKRISRSGKNDIVNVDMFSQKELEEVSKKLKQCINYHRLIVEFADLVSSTFGPMLFFYYLFYQTSLCLQLLECSQITVESLTSYGPLTFINFQQLIQLSMVVEVISTKSEQLKDAVYGVPWEYMDTKNRRTVAIFLMNLEKPIYVKALGLTQVGVTSMATVMWETDAQTRKDPVFLATSAILIIGHVADEKLRTVYFSLCQSLITCCITTWGGARKTTMIQVERAQRAILKIIKTSLSYFMFLHTISK